MIFLRVLSSPKTCTGQIIYKSLRFQTTVASTHNDDKYKYTPCEVYEQKVIAEDLSNDEHQRNVIEQFTHLHDRIKGYIPPRFSKPNFITKWFVREEKRTEKRHSRIPRGVYVWGTVGGGK